MPPMEQQKKLSTQPSAMVVDIVAMDTEARIEWSTTLQSEVLEALYICMQKNEAIAAMYLKKCGTSNLLKVLAKGQNS